jgi:hypothetical protein
VLDQGGLVSDRFHDGWLGIVLHNRGGVLVLLHNRGGVLVGGVGWLWDNSGAGNGEESEQWDELEINILINEIKK